jgi:hypothetical protein
LIEIGFVCIIPDLIEDRIHVIRKYIRHYI